MHASTTVVTAADATGLGEPDWVREARCRSEDPRLFFGPNRFEPKRERLAREEAAKYICRQCPSVIACRNYALVTGETYGVWGGLGEVERRELLHATGLQQAV
ncbi:MAG: WhiB family transcriptional regulator [Nitriliruptoraceae bacterium]